MHEPLAGKSVVILGGLASLPRRQAARLIAAQGGKLARGFGRSTGLLVVGRGRLGDVSGLQGTIERADQFGVPVIGEAAFLKQLGLTESAPGPAEAACRLAVRPVTPHLARRLALLDLIDPQAELQARQALREVGRALAEGLEEHELVHALLEEPERLRNRLPAITLACDKFGKLARRVAGRLAELDGQLRLGLEAPEGPSTDALFAAANEAEAAGVWAQAEELYRRCLAREPSDATLSFNLGNVLREQGRAAEAAAAFARAAAEDPGLAEAWFNLAGLAEERGRLAEARRHYRKALATDPDYADALFNLALLETRSESFAEALPLWQRYLALDPASPWAERARKAAALCRQGLYIAGERGSGEGPNAAVRPQARSAAAPRPPRRS